MTTRSWGQDPTLLLIEETAHMPYTWSIGLDSSKFFHEIEKREVLLGIKCPQCKKVYAPPRLICGPCFVKMNELVDLGSEGVVQAVTTVNYPFIDPDTGDKRPVPYVYGYIQLDGADNLFSHIIRSRFGEPIKVGARVKAVFAQEKRGRIEDIEYFEPVETV